MNELIQRIESGDVTVVDDLRALPSRCIHDAALTTPLAAAIRSASQSVVEALLEDDEVLEYRPEMDPDEAKMARQIAGYGIGNTVAEVEDRLLEQNVVSFRYWQRTPLLEACRQENVEAIAALVRRGADTEARDAIGYDALDLCLEAHDPSVVGALVATAAEVSAPVKIQPDHLELAAAAPDVWDLLVTHGKLGLHAKRTVFNLACARLDTATIDAMLGDGLDAEKAITTSVHPAIEVATSNLAWLMNVPEMAEVAAGFAHMFGHPEGSSISDADLFDDEGNPITFAQADARRLARNAQYRVDGPNPVFISDEQLATRLALLDRLAELGLGPGKYKGEIVQNVVPTNRPELLDKLKSMGFRTGPTDGEGDISWAMRSECFDIVRGLRSHGHSIGRETKSHKAQYAAYQAWLADHPEGLSAPAAADDADTDPEDDASTEGTFWELPGESVLRVAIVKKGATGEVTSLRLFHDNVYGPVEDTDFWVRAERPGAEPPDAFDEADRWTRTQLVSETVFVDGDEIPRTPEMELGMEETPWTGTFEGEVVLDEPVATLQIAIVSSRYPELNGILSDWIVITTG